MFPREKKYRGFNIKMPFYHRVTSVIERELKTDIRIMILLISPSDDK